MDKMFKERRFDELGTPLCSQRYTNSDRELPDPDPEVVAEPGQETLAATIALNTKGLTGEG